MRTRLAWSWREPAGVRVTLVWRSTGRVGSYDVRWRRGGMRGRTRRTAVVGIMRMRGDVARFLLVDLGTRMKEHVDVAPWVRVTSDGSRRVSTTLSDVRRNMVNVHRSKRSMKSPATIVVQNDRRWRATSEGGWRRTARSELRGGRHRHTAFDRATRISTENRTGTCTSVKHQRWTRKAWRRNDGAGVSRRVNVLWWRCSRQLSTRGLRMLEHLQPLGDGPVVLVELSRTGIGVDGVGDLVVATLVQTAEVEPHFGDVRIYPNSTGVGIKSVTELVDLEVKDTDGAPESRVAAVPIDSLLIGLIGLVVLLAGHVCPTQKIPTLSIGGI